MRPPLLSTCDPPLNFAFFYAVRVVAKESMRLVIHRTSCYVKPLIHSFLTMSLWASEVSGLDSRQGQKILPLNHSAWKHMAYWGAGTEALVMKTKRPRGETDHIPQSTDDF